MTERRQEQLPADPYEGKTLKDKCASPTNKKLEVKRKDIGNCAEAGCADCGKFVTEWKKKNGATGAVQPNTSTPPVDMGRRRFLRGLVRGALVVGTAGAVKKLWPFGSEIPPAPSRASGAAAAVSEAAQKSPEDIIYQKILQELEADEKRLQSIIDTVEGPLLDALKKTRTHPETIPAELNKRIAGIIGAIEITRQNLGKNRYSLAIKFLKENNGSVPKHHIKEKNMRSAAHWLKLIDGENLWKISPPYFSYQFNESDHDVAHYDAAAGTLSFSRSLSLQSLVEWMVVIHELTHVVQFQERLSNATPQEITNMKANLIVTTPAGEILLPKYYLIDIEVDAYATCFEIGKFMTEGGFEKIILKNRDDRDHSVRPKNARDEVLMKTIFEGCPPRIADDALNLAAPYFEQAGVYPSRSQKLETKMRMKRPEVLVRFQELFRMSPDEFKKAMWERERQK